VPWPIAPRLRAYRARARAARRWRWLALLVVAGGMMISVVNVSIVNVALPLMAEDLGVDAAGISWVVTGYLVTQATLLPVAGRASDVYGRRSVFLAAVALLTLASVMCALAPSAEALIGFRVLQGVGAAAMPPTAFATIGELFAPSERGRATGIVVGVISSGPVVALAISGVLVSLAGWRSLFWLTPAMALPVLLGGWLILSDSRAAARRRFDLIGATLAAAALFPTLLALSRGAVWGWGSSRTLGLLALGAVALTGFVAHERRTAEPMIDLGLFRLRSLRTANIASGTGAAALFGVLLVLPFYMADVLGFGPIGLALGIMPVAIAYMLVSPLAGRALNAVGADRLAMGGYAIAAAGTLALAASASAQGYLVLLPGILMLSVGLALATAPITVVAISEVPSERMGVASSFPNISRYTGGAFGAAILGSVLGAAAPSDRLTQLPASLRADVADGFAAAALVATIFLVLAFVAAARMPRRPGAPGRPG
jgi:EmrB/QacA subfamily drug resistance transporter